jgi:hypothetical protein
LTKQDQSLRNQLQKEILLKEDFQICLVKHSESTELKIVSLIEQEYLDSDEYRTEYLPAKSTLLGNTFSADSRRRKLNTPIGTRHNHLVAMTQPSPADFRPANWSEARKDITDDNFYISREYYLAEREKNHEDWMKSKQKWMGAPFIASRKKAKDKVPK